MIYILPRVIKIIIWPPDRRKVDVLILAELYGIFVRTRGDASFHKEDNRAGDNVLSGKETFEVVMRFISIFEFDSVSSFTS